MNQDREIEIIGRLLELAARYRLEELEVAEGGLTVRLLAPEASADERAAGHDRLLWRLPTWPEAAEAPAPPARPETARPLLAPLTGTFFRAASPEADPFVEVGQSVEEGQVVGLIEAMKVYSEVHADRAGVVVEIVAQNGQLVQRGDVLLYIDPI